MRKTKPVISIVLIVFLLFATIQTVFALDVKTTIQLSGKTTSKELIVQVVKGDDVVSLYDVEIKDGKYSEEIWFTKDTGIYTVKLCKRLSNNQFKVTWKSDVNYIGVDMPEYTYPTGQIQSHKQEIIDKVKEIVKGKKTDLDKIKAIYQWVYKNIEYDYDMEEKVSNGEDYTIHTSLKTLRAKKGICIDNTLLLASMGRAIGIKTKVVEGTCGKENHAWNEAYVNNRWLSIDSTLGYFDNKKVFDESYVKEEEY